MTTLTRRRAAQRALGRSSEPRPCPHGGRHEHGTRLCYVLDECGCPPCSSANSDYMAQRYRLVVAGQWAPLVDAGPAAAHVQALLEAGLSRSWIAERADVAVSVVSQLLAGPPGARRRRRVRAGTEAKLLAVAHPGLDATGTRRRLQALVAIGWPPQALDDQAGEDPGWAERLLGQDLVSNTTADTVVDLFERLWDCPPPQRTEAERLAADEARARARKNGWGPPMAWDDELNPIDDPTAAPDLGDKVRTNKVPPADDLLFLIDSGETKESLARRFRVQVDTISQALRKARTAQQPSARADATNSEPAQVDEAATALQGAAA